ncbi:MAG: response regulator [Halobacteriales archaeon]
MTSPIRVLHVDDDPGFIEITTDFLQAEHDHFEVEVETTVADAREHLREADVDCIVCDYEMSDQNGIDLLEWVREADDDLPFILFTGTGSEEIASEAISAGVTDYLQKRRGREQFALLANRIDHAVTKYRSLRRADETQRRLRELAEATDDVLYIFDSDWETCLFVNSAFEDLWGLSTDRLLEDARVFIESVHAADRDRVREAVERTTSGESAQLEYRIDGPDGEGWMWSRAEPILDDDGGVVRIAGVTRDVTRRKRRERELEHERSRFASLFKNFPEPTVAATFVDGEPIIEMVNDAFEERFGIDRSTALGESVNELIVPEADLEQARDIDRQISGGEVIDVEVVRGIEGDRRVFNLRNIPIGLEEGPDVFAVYNDVTEQRERENTLTALQRATRDVAEAEDAATVLETLVRTAEDVLDFDLVAVDVQRDGYLIQEAWKLDKEDAGYFPRTSLDDDDTFGVRAYNRQETIVVDDLAASDVTPADPEYRSALTVPIGRFGTFQTVASEVGAFGDQDREFAELLVEHASVKLSQLQERLELRERTRELERQNERLDRFASIISHDVRNPLNVASGRLELARAECETEELDHVAGALDRIEVLIEDTLTLARQGKTVAETEPIDIEELASQCWNVVSTAEAELELVDRFIIHADRERLRQVFENMLRNAVEHGGANVTIRIGRIDGDGFYLEDDGVGIPPEERETVFDPGMGAASKGSGFGLAIVEEIVSAHNWTIEVTESADGGARFEITDVDVEG